MDKWIIIKFPWRSKRRPQHRPGHDGDWRGDNHSILILYAADGWAIVEKPCEKPHRCNRTRNQDNPSDSNGTQLSGNSRRTTCYGPPAEVLRSMAQSVPTPQGTQGRLLYLVESDHALAYTNNYSSSAPAESGNRKNPLSRHRVQSHAHRADTGTLVVGSLKVYCCKVSHSSLALRPLLFRTSPLELMVATTELLLFRIV